MVYKLLVVAPDFYPNVGGYASAFTAMVRALAAHGGFAVDVLTPVALGDDSELEAPHVSVRRVGWFGSGPSPTFRALRVARLLELRVTAEMLRMQRRVGYDFILFETAELPLAALAAVRAFGRRVVLRVHGCAETEWTLFRQHPHWLLNRLAAKRLFRKIPSILSTTDYYLDFVRRWYLRGDPLTAAEKFMEVVPNTAWIAPSPRLAPEQAELIRDRIVLLTVGRLDREGLRQKNFTRLVLALALLRERPYFARLRLLVVGTGSAATFVRRLAKVSGIEGQLVNLGGLPNAQVQALMSAAHAFILPSIFDGQAMSALEALGNGAPILVASNTGLSSMVLDGENGLVFDPISVDQIAACLDRFVVDFLPRLPEVRAKSRQLFDQRFAPDRVALKMQRCLRTIGAIKSSLDSVD